ncbi:G-type lectin S-receptor-like serine/threonine-protein kinase SD2-5 [Magnolia sinica]|uniref:G-type lectin S-receptor-like serine/threonine-protein kinase SD2-5 n=1 Tax=Magnolia sinica TaxID=86752 RepID=UPI002657BCF7|nr:G-type lectin S-receptor-like serine/threonine-protein kinase SD2-5 [Magnolia sinica]
MALCIFFLVILTFPFWHSSALTSFEEPSGMSRESTWFNNKSITDTIGYGDGSLARLILESNSSNPDSPVFACGFICTGTCDSYFLAVVILREINTSATDPQGGFPGVVWLANRDHPIRENGTLSLTSDGDLVLRDSDNTKIWSTDTSGMSIIGIFLQEDGNLQLYSADFPVWESFNHPTDTLLPGQNLYEGRRLIASSSAKNWSSGQYYAEMTSAGFAAFVEADRPLMYVQLMPGPYLSGRSTPTTSNTTIRYGELNPNLTPHTRGCPYTKPCGPIYENRSTTYAALDGENLALTIEKTNYSIRICPDSADGSYHYLRLGFDGHLRTYRWQKNGVLEEVYDFVVQTWDDCQYPHDCGDYGVCRGGGNCSCLKALNGSDHFKRIKGPLPNQGCSEITPLSCQSPLDRHRLVDFGNLSYFNFIDSRAADQKLKDLDGCKQACLKNCDCKAAFFKYGSNTSDGDCYLLSKILSIRANPIPGADDFNSSAFFKIQLSYSAPRLPPPRLVIPLPVKSRSKVPLAAVISGSVALLVVFIVSAICVVISRKKKKREGDHEREYFKPVLEMPRRFSYEDLRTATKDFKEKLGEGGFGSVFKGILEDGTKIAVKQLENIGQGMKEFLAEVETIGNIHHFNLVRLIGFCAERSHQLLVYEYMSNGSLDSWIFDRNKNQVLDWLTRKKIILDIAKGLAYLHEECRQRIVHLDIKPQNILLDDNFNAKVSDFGLSKLMDRDQSQVQTTMRGTPGYLAPEWQQLRVTLKVDIYSFGIVVLEIVCGRKNLDRFRSEQSKHLLRLLQEKAEENCLIDIIGGSSADMQLHREEAVKMIRLAAWCLQDDHTRRPLMSMVVKVLEGAMEVEPEISYRFCNAMVNNPTTRADSLISSNPQQASVLSAPR